MEVEKKWITDGPLKKPISDIWGGGDDLLKNKR